MTVKNLAAFIALSASISLSACSLPSKNEKERDKETESVADSTADITTASALIETASADKFNKFEDWSYIRSKNKVTDESDMYYYMDGEPYPYEAEMRYAMLVIPQSIKGFSDNDLNQMNKRLLQLLDLKGSDSDLKSAATRFVANDGDSRNVKIMKKAEYTGLGIVTTIKVLYPTMATDKFVEFCCIDGVDGGSGSGSSYMCAPQYVVFLRQTTPWNKSHELNFRNIFKGGEPSSAILSMLNQKIKQEDTDGWFSKAERVPENIRFSKEGITFIFAKYEIAPGAGGNPEFTLSWSALKPYLNPDFYSWITGITDWKSYPAPSWDYYTPLH